jgi:hypothetical protein
MLLVVQRFEFKRKASLDETRSECTISLQSQSGDTRNGVPKNLCHPKRSNQSKCVSRLLGFREAIEVDLSRDVAVYRITVTCFSMISTNLFGRKVWETSLLHDNLVPRVENLTKAALATTDWEFTNHRHYNTQVSATLFNLFDLMKVRMEEYQFRTEQ